MSKNSYQRGYNNKWHKARNIFLKENPLCVFCKQENKITASTIVDHIKPHKGDSKLFWSSSNWQALCSIHHQATKQRIEKGHSMPVIGLDGWPIEQV